MKRLNELGRPTPFFKEREVWWCSIGLNVDSEENGKGELGCRPVLILKKINSHAFIGIAISSKSKKGKFYHTFELHRGKPNVAILSQIRLYDSRRLVSKMGILSPEDFEAIRKAAKDML